MNRSEILESIKETKEKLNMLENQIINENALVTKQQLANLALKLNYGTEIDWCNFHQIKYSISYDYEHKQLIATLQTNVKYLGQVYCLNKEFLKRAKKEIGEKRLVKLIKSGV